MPIKIGHTEEGYSYIGGNAGNSESWKRIGSIEDNHVYMGGDPASEKSWEPIPSESQANLLGLGRGLTAELRPSIAAAGAAAGGFYGGLKEGLPLGESINIGKESFKESRGNEIRKQKAAEFAYPERTMATNIIGSVPSTIMAPMGTLGQAAKTGLAFGTSKAIGTAESPSEAAITSAEGGLMGAASYGVGKGLGYAYDKGKELASKIPTGWIHKIGSTLTGINENLIETYSKHTDEINKMIKQYGEHIPEAVNNERELINKGVAETKNKLSKNITKALDSVDSEIRNQFGSKNIVPIGTITNSIEKIKSQLHPILRKDSIEEIDNILNEVISVSDKNGFISYKDLYEIQRKLQEYSKGAFLKDGKMFIADKGAARAAKAGYEEARMIVNKVSPAIEKANMKYHKLHKIEEKLNPNILAVDRPEGSFLAAATSGRSTTNGNLLYKLGKVTGTDPLQSAKKVATSKEFYNAKFSPSGPQTGVTMTRLVLGSGIGAAISDSTDHSPITGALIGAATTSPFALKQLIQTKNVSSKAIDQAIKALSSPKGINAAGRIYNNNQEAKDNINAIKRRLMAIGAK